MAEPLVRRRAVLTAATCAALAGAGAGSVAAAPLDLAKPSDRLRAYMLMRGALDGQLVIGCASGTYYGIMDGETRPLFGFVSATFARYRAVADGYEAASHEVPFFTDLAGNTLLERWKNPYTGELVTVPLPGMPPAKFLITSDLQVHFANLAPGLTLDHAVLPAVTEGDDVWMVEQTFATIRHPGLPKPAHFTEIVTLHAQRAALAAPGVSRVPCLTGYQGIGGWRAWQRMGDRPGSLTGNGFGRYGVSMTEIPQAWRDMARSRRPDAVKDPGAALAGLMGQ